MHSIHRIRDGSLPHTAFTLVDYGETAPEDSLLCTEILCAASLMIQAVKLDREREFKVAPVCVFYSVVCCAVAIDH